MKIYKQAHRRSLLLIVMLLSACGALSPKSRRNDRAGPIQEATENPVVDVVTPPATPDEPCSVGTAASFDLTYVEHIRPILSQHCLSCHRGTSPAAGWDLSIYDVKNAKNLPVAKAWAHALSVVESGKMPLGTKFPPDDLAVLKKWADLGFPESNAESCDPMAEAAESILPVCSIDDQTATPRRIWRLTHSQYGNTTRSLLGFEHDEELAFGTDPALYGFDNFSSALRVDAGQVDRYRDAAIAISDGAVTENLSELRSRFDPLDKGVAEFVKNFGRVLYRRTLTARQVTELVNIHTVGAQQNIGYKLLLEAMLQSPYFLYRTELGDPALAKTGKDVDLTQHEIASLISFTILDEGPSEALLDLADQKSLDDPDTRAKQVALLMKSSKSRRTFKRFFGMLLDINKVTFQNKEPTVFPQFSPDLAMDMYFEYEQLLDHVLTKEDGSLEKLFSSDVFFPNDKLSSVYANGVASGGNFTAVRQDDRAGILNSAAFLTVSSNVSDSNPFYRGKLIRERLLCTPLGSPPADIPLLSDIPDVGFDSRRDRFAEHSKNPSCRGCHDLIDDIGFSFDSFDAIGQMQNEIDGKPVVTAGFLKNVIDGDKKIADAAALSLALADSEHMKQCVTLQFYRFANGYEEKKADGCSIRDTYASFRANKFNLFTLLTSMLADERRYKRLVKD